MSPTFSRKGLLNSDPKSPGIYAHMANTTPKLASPSGLTFLDPKEFLYISANSTDIYLLCVCSLRCAKPGGNSLVYLALLGLKTEVCA